MKSVLEASGEITGEAVERLNRVKELFGSWGNRSMARIAGGVFEARAETGAFREHATPLRFQEQGGSHELRRSSKKERRTKNMRGSWPARPSSSRQKRSLSILAMSLRCRGAVEAAEAELIEPVLVGPAEKIKAVAQKFGLDISQFEIVQAEHSEEAAEKGVQLIQEAKGEVLMKGSLHTDELMRSVTSKTSGLRTARRISHAFIMDVPTYKETLLITDAAINIFPDLEAKRDIVQNAIDLYTHIAQGTPPGLRSCRPSKP